MGSKFGNLIFVLAFAVCFSTASAQAKRNARQPKPAEPAAVSMPTPEPTPQKVKKNERPTNTSNGTVPTVKTSAPKTDPLYRYEFSQPEFLVSHIVIEHDVDGTGMISFKRRSIGEDLSESITISPSSLEKLNAAFAALNFIDSAESYQFAGRDFSHMGNITITLRKQGKERTAKYNWTSNAEAKILMDEYRKIANQFVWMFDFNLARENQPLETPRLVDSLDSLLKRNEISDPHQMLPFLQTVSNDERVPLIGRNHAGKLAKQIEKQKKSN